MTLLFMKYVSDKYHGKANALIEVPEGGSFKDMVALMVPVSEIRDAVCLLSNVLERHIAELDHQSD